MAKTNVMPAPWDAFAIAVRMKRLLRADVDREMHVAIVKGLKRYLPRVSPELIESHVYEHVPRSNSSATPA